MSCDPSHRLHSKSHGNKALDLPVKLGKFVVVACGYCGCLSANAEEYTNHVVKVHLRSGKNDGLSGEHKWSLVLKNLLQRDNIRTEWQHIINVGLPNAEENRYCAMPTLARLPLEERLAIDASLTRGVEELKYKHVYREIPLLGTSKFQQLYRATPATSVKCTTSSASPLSPQSTRGHWSAIPSTSSDQPHYMQAVNDYAGDSSNDHTGVSPGPCAEPLAAPQLLSAEGTGPDPSTISWTDERQDDFSSLPESPAASWNDNAGSTGVTANDTMVDAGTSFVSSVDPSTLSFADEMEPYFSSVFDVAAYCQNDDADSSGITAIDPMIDADLSLVSSIDPTTRAPSQCSDTTIVAEIAPGVTSMSPTSPWTPGRRGSEQSMVMFDLNGDSLPPSNGENNRRSRFKRRAKSFLAHPMAAKKSRMQHHETNDLLFANHVKINDPQDHTDTKASGIHRFMNRLSMQ